jgi:hypothetical protein
LAVEQDRIKVRVSRGTAEVWLSQVLTGVEDGLYLPDHGLTALT